MRYNPVVRFFRALGIKSILFSLFVSAALAFSLVFLLEVRALFYDDETGEKNEIPLKIENEAKNDVMNEIKANDDSVNENDENVEAENVGTSYVENDENDTTDIETEENLEIEVKNPVPIKENKEKIKIIEDKHKETHPTAKNDRKATSDKTKNETRSSAKNDKKKNLDIENPQKTTVASPVKIEIETNENPVIGTTETDKSAFYEPDKEKTEQKSTIGAKEKPDSVGDIVFSDGSASAYTEFLSDEQAASAVGVVGFIGDGVVGTRGKAYLLGLKEGKNLAWGIALSNIPEAVCSPSQDSAQYGESLAFAGETSGVASQKAVTKSDYYTRLSFTFAAFNFALNYTDINGTGGWYVPSVAELARLYGNLSAINTVLAKISGAEQMTAKSYC